MWCVAVGGRRRTSRDQRRRSYQQNFLTDRDVVTRLVADVVPGDLGVDFGAGTGTLTLPAGRWRVIANPPFGLTTALLHRLLDDPLRGPVRADLVLQWEMVGWFAAQPPRTLLATTWAPWWTMTFVQRIARTAFRPIPGTTRDGCVSNAGIPRCSPPTWHRRESPSFARNGRSRRRSVDAVGSSHAAVRVPLPGV